MKIYISGAITGVQNYRENFDRAAAEITAKGHEAVNPCDLDKILNPKTTSWDRFMMADIGLLRACDAICLLEGWEHSEGAKIERDEAETLGLTIYKGTKTIKNQK